MDNKENMDYYNEILTNHENFDKDELEESILYIDEIKNIHRRKNKEIFELFDDLQEKCYQVLETKFNVAHEKINDYWNKSL